MPVASIKFDPKNMATAMNNLSSQIKSMQITASPVLATATWRPEVYEPCDVLVVGRDMEDCTSFVERMETLGEFNRASRPTAISDKMTKCINTNHSGFAQNIQGMNLRAPDVFFTSRWRMGQFWRDVERELNMMLARRREGIKDCREWAV